MFIYFTNVACRLNGGILSRALLLVVYTQMTLFYVVLNSYFISSSRSTPLAGAGVGSHPADRASTDQWCPVPVRFGARHDGSDLGMRCFVSMVDVSGEEDGGGSVGGGRCITVTLPRAELDRIGQPTVQDLFRPNFTVRL